MNRIVWSAGAAMVVALAGCTVGPNFHRPQAALPPQWATPTPRGVAVGLEPQTDLWWKAFNDPTLDSLIERAVAANYDLKVATAKVAEARAQRGVANSDRYPQVNATVSATRNRDYDVALVPQVGGITPTPVALGLSNFNGQFDASWELDFFGRVRREVEASTADLAAAEQDRRNILITLLGDVGRYYADLRGQQTRLTIAEQNIAVDEDTVGLTRSLPKRGRPPKETWHRRKLSSNPFAPKYLSSRAISRQQSTALAC